MKYAMNHETRNALSSLSYWQAELSWATEKGIPSPEIGKIHNSLSCACDECDRLSIPFWVQNAALSLGWDWRVYESTYFNSWMSRKGITLAA